MKECGGESTAIADGIISQRGRVIAQREHPAAAWCKSDPLACSDNLLRALTGLSFGVVTTELGATRSGVAGGVTVDLVSVRYPLGGGDIGKIRALRSADSHALLQFTLLNLPAVFSCRDTNGALHPPVVGHMLYACVPGARFGFGAVVGELSWDPMRQRRTVKWADVAAVANLAGAPSSMAYLRGHLDASLRVAVDSVWHGVGETRSGTDHMLRGGVALDGVIRSRAGHWEATLQLLFRPTLIGTVAAVRNYGFSAEAAGWYHAMIDSTVISVGLDVQATHWSDPSTSIGALDATTDSPAVFAGATLRVRRESKP